MNGLSAMADGHSALEPIDRRISLLLSLPLASLDKLAIQKEIDQIGKEMPGPDPT